MANRDDPSKLQFLSIRASPHLFVGKEIGPIVAEGGALLLGVTHTIGVARLPALAFPRSTVGKFRRIFQGLLPIYLQSHVHSVHGCPPEGVVLDSWTQA